MTDHVLAETPFLDRKSVFAKHECTVCGRWVVTCPSGWRYGPAKLEPCDVVPPFQRALGRAALLDPDAAITLRRGRHQP